MNDMKMKPCILIMMMVKTVPKKNNQQIYLQKTVQSYLQKKLKKNKN